MSDELIDNWLDNEVDDECKTRLEAWLRDDPENLRRFFDAVQLQEDLRRCRTETDCGSWSP